jgi:hypothetical protein
LSNQANIRDIQILGDLKSAFARFGEEVYQILPALQKQFEEIQEQMEKRHRHWQRQTEIARQDVYQTRRALSECQCQPDDEDGNSPNCSFEEDQVRDAEQALAESEGNLETVKQWRHRVEVLIVDFQNDIHRLTNLASSRTTSAQAFLSKKLAILEHYLMYLPPVNKDNLGATIANAAASSTNIVNLDALQLHGNDEEKLQLRAGFEALAKTGIGKRLISIVDNLGTEVRFGLISDGIAAYLPGKDGDVYNKIVLSRELVGRSAAVIATHLAHEATHVKWSRRGSIEQEFDAFKTQVIVWVQLGKDELDRQNDAIRGMMLDGEEALKNWIKVKYHGLPIK